MKKLLVLALGLTLACTCLYAQDAPPAEPPADEAPKADVAAPPARRQITPEQIQERQTRRLREAAAELKAMYDANQDGVIDPQERAKLDADLDTAQRLQRYLLLGQVLNEVDTDRNLEISDEESAKILEAMRKLRPGMGPGGRGPGMPGNGPRGNRPNGPRGNRQGPPPLQGAEPPAPPAED
ncbi:MAG: hypothetical protein J5654_07505 [Victivallales bacterium]|nr:hypothetical protein [Victivallales bacterium]